jgi:hypothetical protein
MEGQVDVRCFGLLYELDWAMGRFANVALESLQVVEQDVRRAMEEIDDRKRYGERNIRYWREAYEEAGDSEDKRYAARRLESAEDTLRRTCHLAKHLQDRIQAYQRQADKLRELATGETIKARHYLRQSLEHLQTYTSVQLSSSSGSGPSENVLINSSTSVTGAQPSNTNHQGITFTNCPLPKGYRWVGLDEVNLKEIPDNMKFEKIDSQEMKTGLCTLQQKVLPSIQEKPERDSGYFNDIDRKADREYQHGQQRVYDAFFGQDHIRLERLEGDPCYSITNGRHRIKIAQELGWDAIPAKTVDVPRR